MDTTSKTKNKTDNETEVSKSGRMMNSERDKKNIRCNGTIH